MTPEPTPEERALEFANAVAATRLEAPHFICPDCGPGVIPDEDGCCQTCGATTLMSDAEWYVAAIREAEVRGARKAIEAAARVAERCAGERTNQRPHCERAAGALEALLGKESEALRISSKIRTLDAEEVSR